ncbi:hypothetical protein SAMN02745218_01126 [Desulfofundulus australicus DSM 11792]|uniref:Uncharacterized protein n=1 Tax=Desulfofundulus australicus DSM 11792 TaxID=1121425 RepID=A0A1M4XQD6_9FIRM|nr:hypothetical protein SAMN02745218_01126 [Desulfofundulus australicus DSM 11792]
MEKDVYRGAEIIERRRLKDLRPYVDELLREGFKKIKSPRFIVFLKHPERDDWAVVTKSSVRDEYILIRGGLDFMFGLKRKTLSYRGCTKLCGNDCPVFKASLSGLGHKIRPS